LAILLQVMADSDLVEQSEKKTPRLGRLRGLFDDKSQPEMRKLIDDVASRLGVRDVPLPSPFASVLECHRTIMAVEAVQYHRTRLQRHPEEYKPNIRSLLEEGLATSAQEYARCKDHQRELSQAMDRCFEEVAILLTPATTGPAPTAETTGD